MDPLTFVLRGMIGVVTLVSLAIVVYFLWPSGKKDGGEE